MSTRTNLYVHEFVQQEFIMSSVSICLPKSPLHAPHRRATLLYTANVKRFGTFHAACTPAASDTAHFIVWLHAGL